MTRKEAVGADARIRPRVDASIDPYDLPGNCIVGARHASPSAFP